LRKLGSSLSDSGLFRSIIVLIIVFVCVGLFLYYSEGLSQKAESIANEQVLNDIKYSLAMLLYEQAIKGERQGLIKFDGENPFIVLAKYRSLPGSYHGAIDEYSSNLKSGWYFEKKEKVAILILSNGQVFRYVLKYIKNEKDTAGMLMLIKK
jgi:hypothetical protein